MSGTAVAKKRGRKAQPGKVRTDSFTVRCRPEFKAWLMEFAEDEQDTPSRIVNMGLICLAKQKGRKPPPAR